MGLDEQIQAFSDHLLRGSDAEVVALAQKHRNAELYQLYRIAMTEMKRRAIVPLPIPIRR